MALSDQEIVLKKFAGAIGIIQGVAWTVLSIICIVKYFDPVDPDAESWMEVVNALINIFYFYNVDGENIEQIDKQILAPNRFVIFSFIYLVIDALWVLISARVYFTNKGNLSRDLKLWSALTGLICLVDLILVAILSADYYNCQHWEEVGSVFGLASSIVLGVVCANSVLLVLVIAAKGFVLWIVNVVFAVVLLKLARKNTVQPLVQYNYNPYQNNYPLQFTQPNYPQVNAFETGPNSPQPIPDNKNNSNFAEPANNWNYYNPRDYYNRADFQHQNSRHQ